MQTQVINKDLETELYDSIRKNYTSKGEDLLVWAYEQSQELESKYPQELETKILALQSTARRYGFDLLKKDFENFKKRELEKPLLYNDKMQNVLEELVKLSLLRYCKKVPEEQRSKKLNDLAKKLKVNTILDEMVIVYNLSQIVKKQ